ncbi:hypothetical protein LZC95_38030 [Pendulispora brunnea]|uniref:Uncharacterized protein n=1 Tax=Pendulispora brunnea TaxID=2905690 RepID=A0ABZ2K4G2_9BACT
MRRPARLEAARHWLPTFNGKNLVRGYAKWFGVDLGCALKELLLLGVALDPIYVERLRTSLRNRASRAPSSAPPREDIPEESYEEWYAADDSNDMATDASARGTVIESIDEAMRLLRKLVARASNGEEFIIAENGALLAKLGPIVEEPPF